MEFDLRRVLGELQRIPNQITALRVALTIALFWILDTDRSLFVAVLIVAGLTDVLDGYLARRLGLESAFGLDFDSLADWLMILCAPWWLRKLCPGVLAEHPAICLFIVACLLLTQSTAVIQLRQPVNFHHYSDKAAFFLGFVAFVWTVVRGYYAPVWYALAASIALQSLETILVCLLVPDPLHQAQPCLLLYQRAPRKKGAHA